jgi:hypothetical protein
MTLKDDNGGDIGGYIFSPSISCAADGNIKKRRFPLINVAIDYAFFKLLSLTIHL